jgi:hypothetical protein
LDGAVPVRWRGLSTVAGFASSYAFRRPLASVTGGWSALPAPAALIVAPVAVGWSLARAATGLSVAVRVGLRVRSAPCLVPRHELVATTDELASVCALVSDTHLTAGGAPSELAVDPGQWPFRTVPGSRELVAGVRRVLAAVASAGLPTVVWCGDEVDSGDPAEWAEWRAAIAGQPGLVHRLIPGNHDVCFNAPHDDDHTLRRRAIRERAFGAHGPRLADFPVVDVIATDRGPVTVILLDSCTHPSKHVLSNAIGRFGEVQLAEVERILARTSGPVLCASHHHVWRSKRFLQPDEWFNTALDSDRLAQILLAYRCRGRANHVLVCHGHRHTLTAGRIVGRASAIDVIGLPSTTLGDKSTGILDGVLRYAVPGLRADGSWGVALVSAGRLVGADRVARAAPLVVPVPELRALSPRLADQPRAKPGSCR